MKIGRIEIVSGPNMWFYLTTIMMFGLGGWKAILYWLGFCLLIFGIQILVDRKLRETIFAKPTNE